MPIGSGIVYNTGDLILSQVSSSGTAFLETKIAAATSSLIYFDSTARINSASLNSITVGTASYVSGSTSIITNLTASNISASGTGSFGIVGIGTVNPAYKLDVNGNANFTNGFYTNTDASSTSYFVGANGTRPIIFQNNTATSYDFGFKFTDSNTFTIVGGNTLANPTTDLVSFTYDGKVGIGTTGPSVRLHLVTGSIGGTAYPLYVDNNSGGAGVNVVGIGFANGGIMKHSITTAIYGNDYMAFNVGQGASYNQERMRIDSNGNVGIGTTSPATRLHVYSAGGGFEFGVGSSNCYIETIDRASVSKDLNTGYYTRGTGSFTWNNGAYTERMRINSDGNLGIGTTSPNSKLEVAGPAGTAVVSVTNSGNGRSGSFGIDGNGVFIRNSNNGDYFDLENASGTSKFRVVYDNNTFLNTTFTSVGSLTASGSKLSVFGNLSVGSTYGAITASSNGAIFEGNVGIGTSNAAYTIQVGTGANSATARAAFLGGYTVFENSAGTGNPSITFNNDIDTGILNPAANTIAFNTNGSEKVRIDSSGNVGIGTSSPAQKLEVQSGSVLIRGDGTALFGTYYASAGENTFFTLHSGSGNTFHIGNDVSGINYNTMVFTAATDTTGGKVGIGTSSPGSKLQINDNTPVLTIRTNDGGVSRKAYIDFYTTFFNFPSDVGARRTSTIVTGFDSGVWGTEFLSFNVGSGSTNDAALLPIERVRIDGSGNVGIGTTSPIAKLQVAGNISGSSFTSSISNAVGFLGTSSWAQNVVSASYALTSSFATTAQTANALNTGNSYTISGLTNNSTLSQQGTLSMGSGYQILATTGTAPIPGISFVGDTNTGIYAPSADTLGFSISGSERVRIDSSGNLGIGTSSPTAKIDTLGVRIGRDFSISNRATVRVDSNGTANPSDILFGHTAAANETSWNGVYWSLSSRGSSDSNRFHFYRGSGNPTGASELVIMTLDPSMNVGIGTTAPLARLHLSNVTVNPLSAAIQGESKFVVSGVDGNIDLLSQDDNSTVSNAIGLGRYHATSGSLIHKFGIVSWANTGTIGSNTGDRIGFHYGTNANTWDSTELLTIKASGNVGIGTTNPFAKLQVAGNISGSSFTSSISNAVGFLGTSSWAQNVVSASFATTAQTANALNTSNNYQVNSIGVGMAGSGTAGRIGLNEVGIRSWSITPTGGRLVIEAGDGLGSVIFSCPVTSSNFVGPGTGLTGTAASLTAGTANALNASNTYTVAGLTSAYVDVTGAGTIPTTGIYRPSTKTLGLSADSTLIFKISNASAPATSSIETGNFIVQSGNVGIGTANATDKLTVYGALASYKNGADTIQTQVYLANAGNTRAFNVQLNSGGTGLDLWSYNSSNAWLRHTTFNYDGNVGIGTAAPAAKLEITGSSNSALLNIKSPISGAILYVSGSGAVGIGTSNVGAFTLQVNGSFGATTKSFIIDHPTKAGKKLMYGSLESPYHGIRLTGRDTLVNGKCKVELPDYIYKLILHDSVNIQLTGIKCNKTLYVDDINIPENYFTIAYDKAIFESYKDYDFFWDFTAIRADVPELTTEL